MKVIITKQVHRDLESIYLYIAQDSYKYANKTIDSIYSYFETLKQMPYIGRYVPEIKDKKYREIIYKNYRIIYKISQKQNLIHIISIIHSKRNFISLYKSKFLKK